MMMKLINLTLGLSIVSKSNAIVFTDLFEKPSFPNGLTRSLVIARRDLLALPKEELVQHPDTYSEIVEQRILQHLNSIGSELLTNPINYGDIYNNTLINRSFFNEHFLLGCNLLEKTDSSGLKKLLTTKDTQGNNILHTMNLFNCILIKTDSHKFSSQLNRIYNHASKNELNEKNNYGLSVNELAVASNSKKSYYPVTRNPYEILNDIEKMLTHCGIFKERLIIKYTQNEPFSLLAYSCLNDFTNHEIQRRLNDLGTQSLEILNEKEKEIYKTTYNFRSLPKIKKCILFALNIMEKSPHPIDKEIKPHLKRLLEGTPLIDILSKNLLT